MLTGSPFDFATKSELNGSTAPAPAQSSPCHTDPQPQVSTDRLSSLAQQETHIKPRLAQPPHIGGGCAAGQAHINAQA